MVRHLYPAISPDRIVRSVRQPIDDVTAQEPVPNDSRGRTVYPVAARKAFFAGIVQELRASLPAEYAGFRHRGDFNLMKVWFEHYRVHYEVVVDQQIDMIELGLHFEDGPASTLAFLSVLDARILEIKDHLGPEMELERWTQSWGRLYELRALQTLDGPTTSSCGKRLAELIILVQPMIDSANIRLERPGA